MPSFIDLDSLREFLGVLEYSHFLNILLFLGTCVHSKFIAMIPVKHRMGN